MKKMGYVSLGIVLASALMSGCAGTDSGTTNSSQTVAEGTAAAAEPQDTVAGSITLDDVLNHEATDESAFKYIEHNGGIIIQGCTSEDEIIVIPETINGIKVTSIDGGAFSDIKDTVRGLYISNNIESVSVYSLCNYTKLEALVLGESIDNIPESYIVNDPNLQYIEFKCPAIQNIEFGSINGCSELKAVYFDGDAENIDQYAFEYARNITIFGQKDSNLQKAVEEIPGLTFEVID